jgi:type II secretory pathway pseudopilin PulG
MTLHMRHRHERGFGLLELVVYVGITAVLATASFGFLTDVLRSARKTEAVNEADHALRVVSSRLLHETRSASAIVDASSTFNSDAGRLTLTTATGELEFALSSGRITVRDGASVPTALTPSGARVRIFRIEPIAVTDATAPRSLRFVIEAEASRDARAESGAIVRAAFAASLR